MSSSKEKQRTMQIRMRIHRMLNNFIVVFGIFILGYIVYGPVSTYVHIPRYTVEIILLTLVFMVGVIKF